MNKLYFYWYGRGQSILQRAELVFDFLYRIDKSLHVKEWRTDRSEIINIDRIGTLSSLQNHFESIIKESLKITDVPKNFIDQANGAISLKSLDADLKVKFSVGGAFGEIPSSVVIEIEKASAETYERIFLSGIDCFNPDWATITDLEFVRKVAKQTIDEFWFGWMTYFSKKVELPAGLADFELIELGRGIIVKTTNEFFDVELADHRERVLRCVGYFRSKGLFRSSLK